ncbi:hypothetical protein [Rhizobium sp. Rhizsp42]|uniref:hypothetical protein n=1 Tax=Rhizobium sp. Rhizsp42 TaxID=3243034 RepID=UPI0039B0E2DB
MSGKEDWHDKDDGGRTRARFDFVMETISTNDKTRTAYLSIKPDPRRYSEIMVEGKPHYLDNFLKNVIPVEEVQRMAAEHLRGLPVHYKPPTIGSARKYAGARRNALDAELAGAGYEPPKEKAAPHTPIVASDVPSYLSFISVDLCGSTSLRRKDAKRFEEAYEIFLRELATVVGQFHGSILKTTGDGFIAYIDYPAYTTQCDNTIDLGLTILTVLRDSVNPALSEVGLPELHVRIGADYGAATIRSVMIATTGFATSEVSSDALNRSVKIEQSCARDEFRIGRALYELIHTQWLVRCTEAEFDGSEVGIENYQIYIVR